MQNTHKLHAFLQVSDLKMTTARIWSFPGSLPRGTYSAQCPGGCPSSVVPQNTRSLSPRSRDGCRHRNASTPHYWEECFEGKRFLKWVLNRCRFPFHFLWQVSSYCFSVKVEGSQIASKTRRRYQLRVLSVFITAEVCSLMYHHFKHLLESQQWVIHMEQWNFQQGANLQTIIQRTCLNL